ncbi:MULTISPECIES: CoA-acylating methylmalonate-semialdehyde dehydrogenase [Caldilinea]|uniref:methylmalonate-semialdehyde dehydrogenase (CoA acylating) n=2 Tax=Chloroflexota TaxID=200795 RepID=I0I5X5_CALAS|nr:MULTISPECIES: CoA-acylating methylmalonate-semialdehyde dehydrogenase [Caldilinea]BAM00663.1 methylmalonate-semialdehyde dehydrogenase [Caldilinea aerophila DSM 14535 = NBRC 104270]GIV67908.1 MAG: methylmalonate-semialdehyde dehydrogenase (CoA acylating) [Caldilinea sp.]
MAEKLLNYINGEWRESKATTYLNVPNPATDEVLATVPLSPPEEVDEAARLALAAFPAWRRTPATARIQYLFKLKALLEEHFEELSRSITLENGKALEDARGEMRRAIENVEVACGIPTMMMGDFSEDVARGIDEYMIRQPVGVAAIICPFNFPGMIPFWYLPYAIACGNTAIVKPSERCPITMQKVFRLLEQLDLPKGVVNLVNGGADTVNALLDHPAISAVTFVGSTPVARHVYARASANGKRVQAQGGAKNPIIILPDADVSLTTRIVTDSAFGNAGQRCLAASLAVTVAGAEKTFIPALAEAASSLVVGNGLEPGVQMGPVITPQSKARIESLIQKGLDEGAEMVLDGRNASIPGYERGYFLKPTIIADVPPSGTIARTEIFGPVLGVMRVETVEEAIALVNSGEYGNMACIFTSSGAAARKFRYEAEAGNIGVNIGVAAPMAFFPFSGWKNSFFGTLHAQGKHAVEFFTQTKVVVERWLGTWERKF